MNIAGNTTYIGINAGNISTNTSNIATNTSNISTNTSNIATNTSNIATNASNISSIDQLTTKGDVLVHNGSNYERLPVGVNGEILSANSIASLGLEWIPQSSSATALTYLRTVGDGGDFIDLHEAFSSISPSSTERYILSIGNSLNLINASSPLTLKSYTTILGNGCRLVDNDETVSPIMQSSSTLTDCVIQNAFITRDYVGYKEYSFDDSISGISFDNVKFGWTSASSASATETVFLSSSATIAMKLRDCRFDLRDTGSTLNYRIFDRGVPTITGSLYFLL